MRAPESQREDVVNVYKDLLNQKNKGGALESKKENLLRAMFLQIILLLFRYL